MSVPVALIIFNRPEFTQNIVSIISRARPTKLFVIADGPRNGYPEDVDKCIQSRAYIDTVDWDCEVFKNYSESNLGCGVRPATGISWVFEHVDRAIILEDDCIPNYSFFRYCEELLARFENDERVMMISGRNHLGKRNGHHSYYFNRIGSTWGWATWKRAWNYYDIKIKAWQIIRETSWLEDILGDSRAVVHWSKIFDKAYAKAGNVDYWDYQWSFACWSQNGLAITPRINLIQNIGFGEHASHTTYEASPHRFTFVDEMKFPMQHPGLVIRDMDAELELIESLIGPDERIKPRNLKNGFFSSIRSRIINAIPSSVRNNLHHLLSR